MDTKYENDPLFEQIAGHDAMNAALTDRAAVQAALGELRWWHQDTGMPDPCECLVTRAIKLLELLLEVT